MLRISSCLVAVSLAVVCGVAHVPGATVPSDLAQTTAATSRPTRAIFPLDAASEPSPVLMAQARRATSESPIRFEKNEGQSDPAVRWIGRGLGYSLWITDTEAVVQLTRREAKPKPKPDRPGMSMASLRPEAPKPEEEKAETAVIRLKFVGANPHPEVAGEQPSAVVTNVYHGNDPSKWRENVPSFGKARLKGLYPGIDLVFYGNERQLEFDWEVAPGADPSQIGLKVEGASPSLGDDGSLRLATPTGEVEVRKPIAYQQSLDRPVEAAFALSGSTVRLSLGSYDRSVPLTIDPVLMARLSLGGLGEGTNFREPRDDGASSICSDGADGAWVVGMTYNWDFPQVRSFQPTHAGGQEAFVLRLDAAGTVLSSSNLGGSSREYASHAVPDGQGGVWVIGRTNSQDLPIRNPFQESFGGASQSSYYGDAFVVRVGHQGNLILSSYWGGSADEWVMGAASASDGVWLVGGTSSPDLPLEAPYQSQLRGSSDACVARIATDGSLTFSSYFGGSSYEVAIALCDDLAGGIWLVGLTESNDFPLVFEFQRQGNGNDCFVAHLDRNGALLSSSYLGGLSGADHAVDVVTDGSGGCWFAGGTQSTDFPLLAAFDGTYGGDGDAFVTHIGARGQLLSSSYFGGSSWESWLSGPVLVPDQTGGVWLAGSTFSTDVPLENAFDTVAASIEAYLARVSSSGQLLVASYLGGSGEEASRSVTACGNGTGGLWVAGSTGNARSSGDFPLVDSLPFTAGGPGNPCFLAEVLSDGRLASCSLLEGNDYYSGVWPVDSSTGRAGSVWLAGTEGFIDANAFMAHIAATDSSKPKPEQARLTLSPSTIAKPGPSVTALVQCPKTYTSATLRADLSVCPGAPQIAMSRVAGGFTATSSTGWLSQRTRADVPMIATLRTALGTTTTLRATLSVREVVERDIREISKLADLNVDGAISDTEHATGIACDNAPGEATNQLLLKISPAVASAVVWSTVTGSLSRSKASPGLTSDVNGDNNVGTLTVDLGTGFRYTPPVEFNEVQRPSGSGQVHQEALRSVYATLTGMRTDGRYFRYSNVPILLVRPATVLVHGINSTPDSFSRFVGQFKDRWGVPYWPFATVDHGSDALGRDQGNAVVEYGASKLRGVISATLRLMREGKGTYPVSFDKGKVTYDFQAYRGAKIATRRVDVIGHSYGGMIARWYLQSDGSDASLGWYYGSYADDTVYNTGGFTPPDYDDNVRKLITLGSMWRGVPLANFVNEVFLSSDKDGKGKAFADAPAILFATRPKMKGTLAYMESLGMFRSQVPSLEVLAVDSPWARKMVYQEYDPASSPEWPPSTTPEPFLTDVRYGSVAGDRDEYIIHPRGMYGLMNMIQSPAWFRGFDHEIRPWRSREWNDGIVPFWSAAIPGSYVAVNANHSDLVSHRETAQYVGQWLSRADLPSGSVLNGLWPNATVEDRWSGGSWSFIPEQMGPIPHWSIYSLEKDMRGTTPYGVGRLKPGSWSSP